MNKKFFRVGIFTVWIFILTLSSTYAAIIRWSLQNKVWNYVNYICYDTPMTWWYHTCILKYLDHQNSFNTVSTGIVNNTWNQQWNFNSWEYNWEKDPWYGLWIPKWSTKLYVADPWKSLWLPWSIDTNLPACLNNRNSEARNRCRYMTTYIDGKYWKEWEVKGEKWDIISLRVKTVNSQNMNNVLWYIRMAWFDHGNYWWNVDISISKIPWDFNVSKECLKNAKFWDYSMFLSDKNPYIKVSKIWTKTVETKIPTCKLEPDTNYYINIKNNQDNFWWAIISGFFAKFLAGGHWKVYYIPQDSYNGRWKYYPTSSWFTTDYLANYRPWQNYNNPIINIQRTKPKEIDWTSCTWRYWSSSNTWYYASWEKIVCEPWISNKYQMQYTSTITTTSTLEVSDVIASWAPSFSVNISGVWQKTISHNIKWGESLADIQASVVKDFDGWYWCQSLPSLPYTREYILGTPSNPTNCKKVWAGYMWWPEWTCDFTTTKVIFSCNLIVPAPANTQADIDAAKWPQLPYPFFINWVDPVSTSKCNMNNVWSSECPISK